MSFEPGGGRAPRSVLVARLSALGDVIHTLPSVLALRRFWPETSFSWVCEAVYADLIREVGGIDSVIPVRTKRWRSSPFSEETSRELRAAMTAARIQGGKDVFIDFQGLLKSAVWGVLGGASRRFGFGPESIREKGALPLLTDPIRIRRGRHIVEKNLELAEGVAGSPLREEPLDFATFERRPDARLAAMIENEKTCLVLPATARSEKNWPAERFATLASRLRTEMGIQSVVLWGPGEEDLARRIAEASSAATVAPPTSLRELVWTLGRGTVVIGGDTGPLHIAAAAGTSVVGIFGPTDPARNGPWGQLDSVAGGHPRAIDTIGVDEVLSRTEARLK